MHPAGEDLLDGEATTGFHPGPSGASSMIRAGYNRPRQCASPTTSVSVNTRRWTIGEPVELWLRKPPKHELIGAQVKTLADQGLSDSAIANRLTTTTLVVAKALKFAEAGGQTPLFTGSFSENGKRKYVEHTPEIVRLRDEGTSFERIGEMLGMTSKTASTYYDRGKGVTNAFAGHRGSYRQLPNESFATIQSMLKEGKRATEIA